MKSFSIVIPHYNNVDGLKRLMNSLLFNPKKIPTFEEFINNLTIIVVDDISEKSCYKEIKNLSLKYNFTLISNDKTKSAGTCRNIGLNLVESEYVIFADSDDFFTNNYWESLIDISKYEFDIAFFSPKSVLDENINIISSRHIKQEKLIIDYFNNHDEKKLRYLWPAPWSKVFRTKFLKNNNILFDNTMVSNDIMFSTKSGHLAKKIIVSNNTIYVATKRRDSLENKFNIDNIKIRIKIGLDYKKYCEQCGFLEFSDHCCCYFMNYLDTKPRLFLKLFKYAKKIGVLDDKKYFFKCLLQCFKNILYKRLIYLIHFFDKK